MMNNIITYEQAINLKRLDQTAATYQEIAMEMNHYFMSNTLAQLAETEFYWDLMDLTQAYFNKDYSTFLFNQTVKMFEQFQTKLPQLNKATETFQRASTLMSKLALEENK